MKLCKKGNCSWDFIKLTVGERPRFVLVVDVLKPRVNSGNNAIFWCDFQHK